MDNKNNKYKLIKNNSIPNLKNNLKLNDYYNAFNELPIINSKNINVTLHKKPKQKLSFKKLIFNPISYVYQNKIKLLSQVSPIAKNLNKFYSVKEINDFTRRKFFMKNYHRTINDNNNTTRNKKNLKLISRNNSNVNIINNRPSLNIIDLSNNYAIKENNANKTSKLETKSKIGFITNRHLIDYKKSLIEIYNPKNFKEKDYQHKVNFIHNFLYKTPENIIKNEEKNSEEIIPKYEYISYFGIMNKIITKFTSTKYNKNDEKNFQNKYLKLKVQLKSSDFADYENEDDYRNKKYIKEIQKKTKNKLKEKNKLEKISKRKKGNADVYKERSRNFSELVNGALEQRKEITNRLENLIDIDKKIYEKEFDNIKSGK